MTETILHTGAAALDLPRTLAGCLARLQHYRGGITPLSLYKHFFPDDFARSTAPISPSQYGHLSAREWEFLHLVDTHFFPIDSDIYELHEEEAEDNPDTHVLDEVGIDMLCLGLGDWDENGDLEPLFQVVLILSSAMGTDSLNFSFFPEPIARTEQAVRALLWDWQTPERIYDALKKATADHPLFAGVCDVMDMIDHDTGSPWLDYYSGLNFQTDDFTWSIANIEWLRDNYRDTTLPLLARVKTLADWFDSDIAAHTKELKELWIQTATQTTPTPTPEVKATTATPTNPTNETPATPPVP